MWKLRSGLTYANVMATIAVFLVLGGGSAVALSGSNTVFTDDIANDTQPAGGGNPAGGLVAADLRPGSVGSSEVAAGSVSPGKLGTFPAVHATTTASVSTTNGATKIVPFNSERYDTANMHSTTTNNHILKAPINGKYLVTANIIWDFNSTGVRILKVERVNSSGTLVRDVGGSRQVASGQSNQSVSGIVDLAAGEGVQMSVIQDSGGSLNLAHSVGTNNYPDLVLTFLHP